jgi:hypothetical protein
MTILLPGAAELIGFHFSHENFESLNGIALYKMLPLREYV